MLGGFTTVWGTLLKSGSTKSVEINCSRAMRQSTDPQEILTCYYMWATKLKRIPKRKRTASNHFKIFNIFSNQEIWFNSFHILFHPSQNDQGQECKWQQEMVAGGNKKLFHTVGRTVVETLSKLTQKLFKKTGNKITTWLRDSIPEHIPQRPYLPLQILTYASH